MSAAIWLVYSREHNAWWRPKAAGYTNHIEAAGRYTKAAAEAHCGTRDFHDKDSPPEVMSLAPEAGDIMDDLLGACKSVRTWIMEPFTAADADSESLNPAFRKALRKVNAAIARAEGTGSDAPPADK